MWQDRAACKDEGPDGYFGYHVPQAETTRLLRRCHMECPVQEECLSHALDQPEHHGSWGGFTESELFAIRTRRYSRCKHCGRRWPKARLTPTTTCRWCLIDRYDKEQDDTGNH